MRMLSILLAVLFSFNCFGQGYLKPNEQIILSFQINGGKQVFLVKDRGDKYISYRFGTKDKVEFEYPGINKHSLERFTYSYYIRGGGKANEAMDLNYLYFTNGGYQYVLYQNYFAAEEKLEVGIKVTDLEKKKTVDIKGDVKTKKGTLVDFRDNGLVKIGDDLFD
ncbi:MAG TPA: hypothetical protein VK166_00525 [Chitinophagaceae bacterium]|nr:hypothetical protein [Chitinophagaceae bacterium]